MNVELPGKSSCKLKGFFSRLFRGLSPWTPRDLKNALFIPEQWHLYKCGCVWYCSSVYCIQENRVKLQYQTWPHSYGRRYVWINSEGAMAQPVIIHWWPLLRRGHQLKGRMTDWVWHWTRTTLDGELLDWDERTFQKFNRFANFCGKVQFGPN